MRVTPLEDYSSLRGHTLVVPGSGGLAHLGELCVDALVCTFELRRTAIVHTRHLLPVTMASAWVAPGAQSGELSLTTAAEIYQAAAVPRLSVMQLRSPVAEGHRRALAEELWAWACAEGVEELVILSACSSHVKRDADLSAASELRHVQLRGGGPEASELPEAALALGHAAEPGSAGPAWRLLRGGGLARPLLAAAGAGEGPAVLCLLAMTSEALNWRSMEELARAACERLAKRLLGSSAASLRPPPSWHFQMEMLESPQQLWG
mmetsp:Transcript_118521/g.370671  ORF Transcript_118521/g.370671 Transcript_118521/m.370671 type:complete len:264 (+) Transcript_118521:67-858(+)